MSEYLKNQEEDYQPNNCDKIYWNVPWYNEQIIDEEYSKFISYTIDTRNRISFLLKYNEWNNVFSKRFDLNNSEKLFSELNWLWLSWDLIKNTLSIDILIIIETALSSIWNYIWTVLEWKLPQDITSTNYNNLLKTVKKIKTLFWVIELLEIQKNTKFNKLQITCTWFEEVLLDLKEKAEKAMQ